MTNNPSHHLSREEEQIRDAVQRSGRNAAILIGAVLLLAVLYFVVIYAMGRG